MFAVAGGLFGLCAPPTVADAEYRYRSHDDLVAMMHEVASSYADLCTFETIGTSIGKRSIDVLRLAAEGTVEPDRRPAILIVANIDGDHLVGSEVAVQVAQSLLVRFSDGDEAVIGMLREHTVCIVPRVNPDAAEWFFADRRIDRRRNLRPDDADRDDLVDEDGPDDVNGDGVITMMRVPGVDKADRMADPDEPRVDRAPDRDAGERATFRVLVEGVDDDGDGLYNEDALGGVDLNANFPHRYAFHADGAGPYQVSEPESRALIEYVIGHQNIALVLTYGRHDTLVKTPDGKGRDDAGAPNNIESGDVAIYTRVGERYREITGLTGGGDTNSDGAFHAWAYAQFGVPSFATTLWTVPAPGGAGTEEGGGAAPTPAPTETLTRSTVGDISQETLDELIAAATAAGMAVTDEMIAEVTPEQVEQYAGMMGVKVRRVGATSSGAGGGGAAAGAKSKNADAWLVYSDEARDGEGFVPWAPFDHPQLGAVEIGGWAPYFRTNPPESLLGDLAEHQVDVVIALAEMLPRVALEAPTVKRLASGLYEIRTALTNDGALPTGTAMAVRNRRARPHVVRVGLPVDRIMHGQRVNKVWSIAGSGGRVPFRWIVREDDGAVVPLTVFSEKYGQFTVDVTLEETN